MVLPTVSVVIPTVDRPSVLRAVRSAFEQDLAPLEVVVVRDGPDLGDLPDLLQSERVRLLSTGGGAGAAAARQLGVEGCAGELVAFLDDDDEWRPDKLRRQVEAFAGLSSDHRHVLLSCQAELVTEDGEVVGREPARQYRRGEDVAEYLFVRHHLLESGFGLASSTLMCSAALLREVPWDRGLRLHEDWDLVLRATRAGAVLELLPEPLVRYHLQALGSAASRPARGWVESAAWARAKGMSPRALGDFLLCVSAVNAAAWGERRVALGLAGAALAEGRPSARALAAFVLQLLPRFVTRRAARAARLLLRSR